MLEQPETPETLRLRAAQLRKEAIQTRDSAQHADDGHAFRAEMAISKYMEGEANNLLHQADLLEKLEQEMNHAAA